MLLFRSIFRRSCQPQFVAFPPALPESYPLLLLDQRRTRAVEFTLIPRETSRRVPRPIKFKRMRRYKIRLLYTSNRAVYNIAKVTSLVLARYSDIGNSKDKGIVAQIHSPSLWFVEVSVRDEISEPPTLFRPFSFCHPREDVLVILIQV